MRNRSKGDRRAVRAARRGSRWARDGRRSRIRRAAGASRSASDAARQETSRSKGTLDKRDALAALADMGIAVDTDGPIDIAGARKLAEGAATSAAEALGIDIASPDGGIDTAKARLAVAEVLGFSIEREGAGPRAEAALQAQSAAARTAESMGVDVLQPDGSIDLDKARQVANLALDLKVARARKLGRREALDALNISLDAMSGLAPSRRAASDVVEKLLSSSVLVDGQIDRRKALEALEARF